jgi:hypothetical protein
MKYRKFNKFEKKEVRSQMLANALHGEGIYLYRNNTKADLTLPRPTKSGTRVVGAGKEFQGDNYYMQLVKQGMLRLVKEIQSPEQQYAEEVKSEEKLVIDQQLNEGVKMEEKLILDQPDTVTEKGKVEHVVSKPAKKLNEQKGGEKEKQQDVLLNEGPVEGGFVIVGQ